MRLLGNVSDDDVLVGVRLLLAAVVQGLFFRVFRPLAPPFGAVDDEARLAPRQAAGSGQSDGDPARDRTPRSSRASWKDGQQPMNPIVHLRLTQSEEFAHDDLKGIGLEVDQDKQQLLFRRVQRPLAPPPADRWRGRPAKVRSEGYRRS